MSVAFLFPVSSPVKYSVWCQSNLPKTAWIRSRSCLKVFRKGFISSRTMFKRLRMFTGVQHTFTALFPPPSLCKPLCQLNCLFTAPQICNMHHTFHVRFFFPMMFLFFSFTPCPYPPNTHPQNTHTRVGYKR